MNNNELRIGNYVTDSKTGKVVTVDGIQFTGRVVTHDESYDDWKRGIESVGIPLTPEILEKAGFEKGDIGYDNYEKGYYTVMVRGQGITISNRHGYLATIKYLHQLQNLYFALTGEELPIEL